MNLFFHLLIIYYFTTHQSICHSPSIISCSLYVLCCL
nr:MAG TPA: hypothetical protein [Caudoviricetes sp.]